MTNFSVPRRLAATALTAILAVSATACTKEPEEPEATAADRLTQAHDALLEAGSVHLNMAGTDLPEDQDTYVISADGVGTIEPSAFEGTFTAMFRGVQADMPTVAVDGELWVEMPFVSKYTKIDPEQFNVPDPANLLDKDQGLASLLPKTTDPTFGERVRDGQEVLQEITGTLPGEAIRSILTVGKEGETFDVTYGLVEESWELRAVTIVGEFYPPATSTYTLTFTDHGEPVTIERP